MLGRTRDRAGKLVAAVAAGQISRETARDRVQNMLRLIERSDEVNDHSH
jgi:beta-glucosidase